MAFVDLQVIDVKNVIPRCTKYGVQIREFHSFRFRITYGLSRHSRLIIKKATTNIIANITSLITFIQIAIHHHDYHSGSLMCRYYVYIYASSYGISISTLTLLAIDRYYAIIRPLSPFYRIYRRQFLITCEIGIWILSLLIHIPTFFYMSVHRQDTLLCDFPDITNSVSAYLISFVLIDNILPSSIISITYGRIIIHQNNYVQPGQMGRNQLQNDINKRQLTKMLGTISFFYVITTIPTSFVFLGSAITQKSLLKIRQDSLVAFLLIFFSISVTASISTINPFLYLAFDKKLSKKALTRLGAIRNFIYEKTISTRAVFNNSGQTPTAAST
ncbi:uncharacterized protein TRIADDRAFT_60081 [Trichoplax adhaerens]|uniref:G-protein coupled receptors family 1 profile domain-containing protein n=1 Tax=Trichoplax adhaerens TaxID=10228 RepID=B3S790_TRIAD|nr:hypothetical protein TRIADDRAFT_60081 [Trichoplax adhaerens]EDV21443.1 hypothetical protein TRIADDRAFT_60081 [Trichoplax adhaerens]|eukprot:XP_002116043.1 hypothetical protein TRIADDRAFT_60081 [Trichoplax adhaerens]